MVLLTQLKRFAATAALAVCAASVHAADISLMDRNPVMSRDYLSEWNWSLGIFGRQPLANLNCEDIGCASRRSQAELTRARPAAASPRDLFSSVGGAVGSWEVLAGAANAAVMMSPVVRLSGPIEAGDADRLSGFFQDNRLMNCGEPGFCPYNTVLALDSPGGSLVEALKISEFVRANNIPTLLPAGARCESACSMIFLSGYTTYDGIFHPRRYAHDTAKLGLHTPYLTLPPRDYSAEEVDKVQQIINTSLNNVVELFSGANLDLGILKEMYETPASSMYYLTVPEMESIATVFHSAGAGRFAPTRAQALTLCAEDYKARYGRYEPQLLRRMASADDVFITYAPRSDYACYGARRGSSWVYDVCTPQGSRPDSAVRVPCQLFRCAADFDGMLQNCGPKWSGQDHIDVFNQDSLGDALAAMRNSKLLQIVRDTLTDPWGDSIITCEDSGCLYSVLREIPAWITRSNVPAAYCGEVDMRSPSNLQKLQRALNDNGINVGTPDGSIGPKTLGAIGTANQRYLGKDSQWAEPALLQALGVPQSDIGDFLICK